MCVCSSNQEAASSAPAEENPTTDSSVLTEEQKKQLEELQLFKNKESLVSIEVLTLRRLDPYAAGLAPGLKIPPFLCIL